MDGDVRAGSPGATSPIEAERVRTCAILVMPRIESWLHDLCPFLPQIQQFRVCGFDYCGNGGYMEKGNRLHSLSLTFTSLARFSHEARLGLPEGHWVYPAVAPLRYAGAGDCINFDL